MFTSWLVPVFYVAILYGVSYSVASTAWLRRDDPVVLRARCGAAMGLAIASLLLASSWTWALDVGEVGRTLLLLSPLIHLQLMTTETEDQPRARLTSALDAGWIMARDLAIVG